MTTTDRSTAVGVFTERAEAEEALEALRNAGFSDDEVGFIAPHQHQGETIFNNNPDDSISPMLASASPAVGAPGTGGAPYVAGLGASGAPVAPLATSETSYDELEDGEDTSSGATTGAVGGGVLGGIIGAAAALLIPGFGPVIAGGILAATLGGAALGALAGGLVGALTHLGIPENEAGYYQDELNAGRTVVTVHAPNRFEDAIAILKANGATDASARYTNEDSTYTNAEPIAPATPLYTNEQPVNTATPTYGENQFVETTVPEYSNEQPVRTVPPVYNDELSTDTTTPDTAPIDTNVEVARTAAAVDTTTPNTSISPQAAYTPTLTPTETISERERRNREAANAERTSQATTPDERA